MQEHLEISHSSSWFHFHTSPPAMIRNHIWELGVLHAHRFYYNGYSFGPRYKAHTLGYQLLVRAHWVSRGPSLYPGRGKEAKNKTGKSGKWGRGTRTLGDHVTFIIKISSTKTYILSHSALLPLFFYWLKLPCKFSSFINPLWLSYSLASHASSSENILKDCPLQQVQFKMKTAHKVCQYYLRN